MPNNEVCTVKGLRIHGDATEYAIAGDNVDIGLTGIELNVVT
jgi:hypothetical protein